MCPYNKLQFHRKKNNLKPFIKKLPENKKRKCHFATHCSCFSFLCETWHQLEIWKFSSRNVFDSSFSNRFSFVFCSSFLPFKPSDDRTCVSSLIQDSQDFGGCFMIRRQFPAVSIENENHSFLPLPYFFPLEQTKIRI